MPRKSKEKIINEEIVENKKTTTAKPSKVKAQVDEPKAATKKSTSKSASTAKKSASKTTKTTTKKSKATTKSSTTSAKSSSKVASKSSSKTNTKSLAASKTSTKASTKSSGASKASSKTSTKAARKTSSKASASKVTKATRKAKKAKALRTLKNSYKSLKNKIYKKSISTEHAPFVLEYYDLPYKYNKTVLKALAQNPNTLFVYWEISDEDVQSFKDQYGEDFFNITKPVLVIHNLTEKYSFEIDVNDFANNWYIHVNDTKSQYVIELGRRPKEGYINNLPDNYLYVTSSNMIESPNDHVLFYDSEQYRKVRFKNIHTNKYTTKVIKPFLRNIYELYKSLHLDKENVSFDFKNPSSQNPTSIVK